MFKRARGKRLKRTVGLVRKYSRRKSKVQTFTEAGLSCTGRKELQYVKDCEKAGKPMPKKADAQVTPIGEYTPDFEYPDRFIEIKSLHTFMVCLGLIAYKGNGPRSNKQWQKIQWVATHIKPVDIIIYLSIKEAVPIIEINKPSVSITVKGGRLLKL